MSMFFVAYRIGYEEQAAEWPVAERPFIRLYIHTA
jgi:hypothetical protein